MSCFDRPSWILKYELAWSLKKPNKFAPKPKKRLKGLKSFRIPYDPVKGSGPLPAEEFKETLRTQLEPLGRTSPLTAGESLKDTQGASVQLTGAMSSSLSHLSHAMGGEGSMAAASLADLTKDPSLVTSKDTSRIFETPSIEEQRDPSRPLLRILQCAEDMDSRRNHIGSPGGHIYRAYDKKSKGGPLDPMLGTEVTLTLTLP